MQRSKGDLTRANEKALGRRGFLKVASLGGALPLLACSNNLQAPSPLGGSLAEPNSLCPCQGFAPRSDVYEQRFGLRAVINAAGPVTALGGTLLSKEVTDAMAAASRSFVDLNALYASAGAKLADIARTEAAMVTSGAFAAMTLAAAACLAGNDARKIAALPQPDWPRREVLIQRSHSTAYDQAYRNAGAMIVYVDTEEELRAAIGERTAMIAGLINTEKMTVPGIIPLERLVAIGKSAAVPVYFDASFSVTHNSPPSSLWRYTQMGADMVGISGGKGLHGPQSSGILAGRADLLASARRHATPVPSALGRGLKVDKEEVVGLMVAVEQFLSRDAAAIYRRDTDRVAAMKDYLNDIPGLRLRADDAYFGPGVILMWDQTEIPLTYADFAMQMKASDTPIEILIFKGPTAYFVTELEGPVLYAGYLNDGEEATVAKRAREILVAARGRG